MTSYRVENLQPKTNYTLYLAAITCHGEGVRSEPYPIIASHYLKRMGRNSSEFLIFASRRVLSSIDPGGSDDGIFSSSITAINGKSGGSIHRPPDPAVASSGSRVYNHAWFIACLVGIAMLWLLIFVIILVCRRRRRQRLKQRYPPNLPLSGEDLAFRLKRNGDRSSKMGLLDGSKENGVVLIQQQQQQQPILAPVRLLKHNSPRLQMGTGILTSQRPVQQHPSPQPEDEGGYEAPGMFTSISLEISIKKYIFLNSILI